MKALNRLILSLTVSSPEVKAQLYSLIKQCSALNPRYVRVEMLQLLDHPGTSEAVKQEIQKLQLPIGPHQLFVAIVLILLISVGLH